MGWYDYVPGVSNVAGAVRGDWGQAAFGPAGKVYNNMQDAAGRPYEQAAAGAMGLGGMAQGFSDEQWTRQMEGLGRAQGAYNPSQSFWESTYGTPGSGRQEQAFNAYGGQFLSPSSSSGAYDQMNQYMQGQPMTYGAMNRAHGMAGSAVDYSGLSNQLQGPGSAQNFYMQNQGGFGGPGAMESWYAQNQNSMNRSPSSMEVYDQFSSQLYGPGRSESHQVTGPSWGSTDEKVSAAMGYANQAQGQTRLEGAQGAEVGNMFRGANNVNQFSQSAMPQLQNKGTYEQFVESDIGGYNPELARSTNQGLARVNQEMARRGQFNSGGANTAIGEFLGSQAAADYQNKANRAQSAQGMQMARLGEGRQLAQAGSGETMGQASGLQGLAGTQDAQRLERQQFGANTALAAADKGIAMQNTNLTAEGLKLQAANNADSQRNARLNNLQGMASAGDDAWMRQQQMAGNFAGQAQTAQMARLMGGMSAGQMVDQGQLQRLQAQYGMQSGADDRNLQRGRFQFDMGRQADEGDLARMLGLNTAANASDRAGIDRLKAYFEQAGNVDQRTKDAMSSLFGINDAQGGQYGQFYGQGGQLSGQSYADAIDAMANAYGLRAQGGAARAQLPFQLAGLGIQGGKMLAGGG